MQTVERLRQIREELRNADYEVPGTKVFAMFTDDVRFAYFQTELESSIIVLEMMEKEQFKECFILLRSILEKFLYFWLMMEERRYRRKVDWQIQQQISASVLEARDKTCDLWLKLKKEGHESMKDAVSIQKGKKENIITVIYEHEGYFQESNGKRTEDLIPSYNFILDQYNPSIKHLSNLPIIKEGKTEIELQEKITITQNMIYNYFFYIDSIAKNLILNKLVTPRQRDMIMVHYNFLSSFTHPSKFNIKLWQSFKPGMIGVKVYNADVLRELITLYVAKFMQLYIKALVSGYRKYSNLQKYDLFVAELGESSKKLWFFDDEPTPYDKWWSDLVKRSKELMGRRLETDQVLYYEDPVRRLEEMEKFDPYRRQ